MPDILGQLFGIPQQQQGQQGLVQSILSQRFQPNPEDAAAAMGQTAMGGKLVNPSDVMNQRLAPALGVAQTMGNLSMTQAALERMNDERTRTNLMLMEAFGKMPAGSFPGMGGPMASPDGGMPQQGGSQGLPWQQGSQPPVGFPTAQSGGAMPSGTPQPAAQAPAAGNQPPQAAQNDNRQPIVTGFGMPIPASKDPVMMRDQQGNISAGLMPGSSDVLTQTKVAEQKGGDIATAQKGTINLDTSMQDVINILNDQIKLAPNTYSGKIGEGQVELSRDFANFGMGSGPNPAQSVFEQNNSNLFTRVLPQVMAGLGQSRIDIPLVNAIKQASTVYQYAAPNEKVAAAQNLKKLLLQGLQEAHAKQAALGGGNTPMPKLTDTNPAASDLSNMSNEDLLKALGQ